jgi:hypothetical protein
MPPVPKDPRLRQRRNRVTSAAKLQDARPIETAPALPGRRPDRKKWHPWTVRWWRLVWESPMASEYLESDVPGLVALAILRDNFVRDPKPKLAAEVRQQEMRFGLSPIDRRRLQWEVERVESRTRRPTPRPARPPAPEQDPRRVFEVIQ